LNRFGQTQNHASQKHRFILPRLLIRSVTSPDQLKWRGTIPKKGPLKSPKILLIRIDSLWVTKLERFVAVQLVWVRLRGLRAELPDLGDVISKKCYAF